MTFFTTSMGNDMNVWLICSLKWSLKGEMHVDRINFYYLPLEFFVTHMDEFIDELLREERVCDILLPRIQVNSNALIS